MTSHHLDVSRGEAKIFQRRISEQAGKMTATFTCIVLHLKGLNHDELSWCHTRCSSENYPSGIPQHKASLSSYAMP